MLPGSVNPIKDPSELRAVYPERCPDLSSSKS